MPVRIHHERAVAGAAAAEAAFAAASAQPDRNRIVRVTDSTGRLLGVREAGLLQRLRLYEAAGAENGRNEGYMNLAMLAVLVVEIDGELCEPVATKRQLEARMQQLDMPGLEAVNQVILARATEEAERPSAEELAKNG